MWTPSHENLRLRKFLVMIRWITTDPELLAQWTDKQLCDAYQLTQGEHGDPEADALAAEIERRGIDL